MTANIPTYPSHSPAESEIIELSDDELDLVAGGFHHSRPYGRGHSRSSFRKRSLKMTAQTTSGPHGTTTTFAIDLTEITSTSEHSQ